MTTRPLSSFKILVNGLLAAGLLLVSNAAAQSFKQNMVQEFYIPLPESQASDALQGPAGRVNVGDDIYLKLDRNGRNDDAGQVDSVVAKIRNGSNGDVETVTLVETGPDFVDNDESLTRTPAAGLLALPSGTLAVAPAPFNPMNVTVPDGASDQFTVFSRTDLTLKNGHNQASFAALNKFYNTDSNGNSIFNNIPAPQVDGKAVRLLAQEFGGGGYMDFTDDYVKFGSTTNLTLKH